MTTACSRSTYYFYPRPPRGGRRGDSYRNALLMIFLSTPSARRATIYFPSMRPARFISIHALREEGDRKTRAAPTILHGISIHALREEGDVLDFCSYAERKEFLSTPSARRATAPSSVRQCPVLHFYPRPPRGGRLGMRSERRFSCTYFYPRPPRGGRRIRRSWCGWYNRFLSTPSARRATRTRPSSAMIASYFYPRPPRGGRQQGH